MSQDRLPVIEPNPYPTAEAKTLHGMPDQSVLTRSKHLLASFMGIEMGSIHGFGDDEQVELCAIGFNSNACTRPPET